MIAAACRRLVCCLLLCACIAAQGTPARVADLPQRSVTLTAQHPVGHFEIAPEVLASKPSILFLSITKVVNPQRTSCEVLVSFSRATSGDAKGEKIRLGGFTLYPADQPAGFQLSTSKAFRQLTAVSSSGPERVSLEVTLKRVHETQPWTQVELTIAEPEWRGNGQ